MSAIRYGKGAVPSWLTTLQLAKEWGVNPEDIHRGRGMLKWIARWNAWQRALERDRKMTEQVNKRMSKTP